MADSSTEIEQRNPARDLVNWVRSEDTRQQLALALPDDVPLDRFERALVTALLAKPEIAEADRASLYLALLNAAQAGLVPDGKQGTINVYGGKAQFLVMIGGIRLTLAKYGWTLRTEIVCENDHFEDYSSDGYIVHRKPRPGVDRGRMQGAFAMAVQRDGRRECVVMSKAEIDEVRDKSARGGKSGPWKDWYARMAEKTPGQRLAKKLGLDPQDLIRIAEPADDGDAETQLYGPDGATFQALEAPADHPSRKDEPKGAAAAASGDGGEAGPQQAAASPPPSSGEAPAPGADDEPEPQPAWVAAGQTVVETGNWAGKTLAEVAAVEAGVEWIGWALPRPGKFDPNFHEALATYVEGALPELWAAHTEKSAA